MTKTAFVTGATAGKLTATTNSYYIRINTIICDFVYFF
jgi:hypothetical protein